MFIRQTSKKSIEITAYLMIFSDISNTLITHFTISMPHLEKYHVPSGCFHIGKRQSKLLRAFLGSCVGVAVYDSDAEVGGMIHLLLPEPPLPGSNFQAKRYASTGLPIFLKALKNVGATPPKMKAILAGGALVGAVSEQDVALNIGGRTADMAINILSDQKIHVIRIKTGGFFACTLDLNMENWESIIEPIGFIRSRFCESFTAPNNNGIARSMKIIQPIR
jgi:chemotaxis receptor (MCP) glutamine deamidase CheD